MGNDEPAGFRSTVVDATGKIIDHKNDGDNSVYQLVNGNKVKVGTEIEGINYDQLIGQQLGPLLYNPNPIQLNEVQVQTKRTQANTFPLVLPPPSGTIGLPRIPPPHPILVFLAALISNSGMDAWMQGRRPGDLYRPAIVQTKKSGKDKASDVPSWAAGQKPQLGESGKDFAQRLMDQQYGKGNWSNTGPGSEYNKLKKNGDRNIT